MEKMAIKMGVRRSRSPIELIPDDWVADEGQMHPNLVGTASLDRDLEQCGVRKSLDNVDMRHSWPASPHNGHTLSVLGIATDRCVDGRFFVHERTRNEGKIALFNRAGLPLANQCHPPAVRLCGNDESGGVFVKPVNDSRPL